MDPIDFVGQRSKVKVTIEKYGNKLVNMIMMIYFFIKLERDVNYGERIDPIDFGGQRSRSQWIFMENFGNKLVNMIAT